MQEQQSKVEELLADAAIANKYSSPGCYAIYIDDLLVYIGKSRNMLERLAQHIECIEQDTNKSNKYRVLHEAHQSGHKIRFDVLFYCKKHYQDSIDAEIGKVEGELIRQYRPPLNYQIPEFSNWRKFTVNRKAKEITLSEILSTSGQTLKKNCPHF